MSCRARGQKWHCCRECSGFRRRIRFVRSSCRRPVNKRCRRFGFWCCGKCRRHKSIVCPVEIRPCRLRYRRCRRFANRCNRSVFRRPGRRRKFAAHRRSKQRCRRPVRRFLCSEGRCFQRCFFCAVPPSLISRMPFWPMNVCSASPPFSIS